MNGMRCFLGSQRSMIVVDVFGYYRVCVPPLTEGYRAYDAD